MPNKKKEGNFMECEKQEHPIVGIEGFAASGKQFDLDITIPEDGRNVIYGIVKDCYKNPVCDAVVKLIEVEKGCKEERKPVSHTFTDKHGEFVFGPLCPHKCYAIEIWANRVEHIKICAKCNREGCCLRGIDMGPCDCFMEKEDRPEKPCCKEEFCKKHDCQEEHKPCHKEDHKEDEKKEWKSEKKDCDFCCKEDNKKEEKSCCKEEHKECKPCCKEEDKRDCKPYCKEENKKDCKPCCKEYGRY